MEDKTAFSKFKLKEKKPTDEGEGSGSGGGAASKYFKPGFIFNQKQKQQQQQKKDDEIIDDDLSDTEIEQMIEAASQQQTLVGKTGQVNAGSSSSAAAAPKTLSHSESAALERVNQVASQAVDFTSGAAAKSSGSASLIPSLKGSNTILVNSNQQQNPLLKSLRSVRYVLNDAIAPAHYLLSDSCCALFLSLKYHVINPDYIYKLVNELIGAYQLKVLLLLVDHVVFEAHLKEMTILAVRTNFTLLVAWSYEEAARHIENLRVNAEKPADAIMGRFDDGGLGLSVSSQSSSSTAAGSSGKSSSSSSKTSSTNQSLVEALTSVKSVNRTDATTLLSSFDTMAELVHANTDLLICCPGISMVKAKRLQTLFQKPFCSTGVGAAAAGAKSNNA